MISRFGPNARGRKAKSGAQRKECFVLLRKARILTGIPAKFRRSRRASTFAAASSDVGGIRDGTEIGISGNAKLGKGSQQTNFLNKRGQRVDTGSRGLPVTALGRNAPDVLRPAGEPRRADL